MIVPVAPAAFSAWGMLAAEVTDDVSQTQLRLVDEMPEVELEALFEELGDRARGSLERQDIRREDVVLERWLDLRYLGQEHSLSLRVDPGVHRASVADAFHHDHGRRYGHTIDSPIQILNVRVRGSGRPTAVDLALVERGDGDSTRARVGTREAWCFADRARVEFAVVDRSLLCAGDAFDGPAIVEEGTSTTLVMSDQAVRVDEYGHLLIYRREP